MSSSRTSTAKYLTGKGRKNVVMRNMTSSVSTPCSNPNSAQDVNTNIKTTQSVGHPNISATPSPSTKSATKSTSSKRSPSSDSSLHHERPHRSTKLRLRQKMATCPLCMGEFPTTEIERHASQCMELNSSTEKKKSDVKNSRSGVSTFVDRGGHQQRHGGPVSKKKKKKSFIPSESDDLSQTNTITASSASTAATAADTSTTISQQAKTHAIAEYPVTEEKKSGLSLLQRPGSKKKRKKKGSINPTEIQAEGAPEPEHSGIKLRNKKHKRKKILTGDTQGSEEDLKLMKEDDERVEANAKKSRLKWFQETDENILSASLSQMRKQHGETPSSRVKKRKKEDLDPAYVTGHADNRIHSMFPCYIKDRKKSWTVSGDQATALPASSKPYASVNDAQHFLEQFKRECCNNPGIGIGPLLKFLSCIRLCRTGKMNTYQMLSHCKKLFLEHNISSETYMLFEAFIPSMYTMDNILPHGGRGNVEVEMGSVRTDVVVNWDKNGITFKNEKDGLKKDTGIIEVLTGNIQVSAEMKGNLKTDEHESSVTDLHIDQKSISKSESVVPNHTKYAHVGKHNLKSSSSEGLLSDGPVIKCDSDAIFNVNQKGQGATQKVAKHNTLVEPYTIKNLGAQAAMIALIEGGSRTPKVGVGSVDKTQERNDGESPSGEDSAKDLMDNVDLKRFMSSNSVFHANTSSSMEENTAQNNVSGTSQFHSKPFLSNVHPFNLKTATGANAPCSAKFQALQAAIDSENSAIMSAKQSYDSATRNSKQPTSKAHRVVPNPKAPANQGGNKASFKKGLGKKKLGVSRQSQKLQKLSSISQEKLQEHVENADRNFPAPLSQYATTKATVPNSNHLDDPPRRKVQKRANYKTPSVPDPLQNKLNFGDKRLGANAKESFASYVNSLKLKEMSGAITASSLADHMMESSVSGTDSDGVHGALSGHKAYKLETEGNNGTTKKPGFATNRIKDPMAFAAAASADSLSSRQAIEAKIMANGKYPSLQLGHYLKSLSIPVGPIRYEHALNGQEMVKDGAFKEEQKDAVSIDDPQHLSLKQTENLSYVQQDTGAKGNQASDSKANSKNMACKGSIDKSWKASAAVAEKKKPYQYSGTPGIQEWNGIHSKMQNENVGSATLSGKALMSNINKRLSSGMSSDTGTFQTGQGISQAGAIKLGKNLSHVAPSPWYLNPAVHLIAPGINVETGAKPYDGFTKPEKAKNPYTHFCRIMKPLITAEFKSLPPNVKLKEKVQEETHFRWRSLKEEEKQFFVKKSMMDYARYENEMKIYDDTQQKLIERGSVGMGEHGWE